MLGGWVGGWVGGWGGARKRREEKRREEKGREWKGREGKRSKGREGKEEKGREGKKMGEKGRGGKRRERREGGVPTTRGINSAQVPPTTKRHPVRMPYVRFLQFLVDPPEKEAPGWPMMQRQP